MFKKFISLSLFLFSIAFSANIPDKPYGRINDYTHTLSPSFINKLEEKLASFESTTQNQIVVVIIDSLYGENIESFSMRLAEKWKIGKKELDNGIIITIAMKERKIRIEVGYGLEDKLTDALSSDIIRNTIAPAFKQQKYEKGIEDGIERIMKIIHSESDLSYNYQNDIIKLKKLSQVLLIILGVFLIIFIIDLLRYNLGKSKKIYKFLEWFLIFSITYLILEIIFYILFSTGKSGYTIGHGGFKNAGGGGGFSGGGFSGGGSFSGGGGRFGGGGASGSW